MRTLGAAAIRWQGEDDGQTMAEYSVVLCVISLAVLVVLGVLAGSIGTAMTSAADLIG